MAAKKAGCLGTLFSTLFTSLLAPVVVNVVSAVVMTEDNRGTPTKVAPKEQTRLTVVGEGRTSEEASEDALRGALRGAIDRLPDADRHGREGEVLLEAALRRRAAVVAGCEETSGWRGWRDGREVCCKTMAVTVDLAALRVSLQLPAGRREGGWNHPWANPPSR